MLMSPAKLIVLRAFNITLGRFSLFNASLRWLLVQVLIRRKLGSSRFTASARYFDVRDLD